MIYKRLQPDLWVQKSAYGHRVHKIRPSTEVYLSRFCQVGNQHLLYGRKKSFHQSPPHPHLQENVTTPTSISQVLGKSSLTEVVLRCMCRGLVCCLVGGSVSERSQGSRLVETAGLPMGSSSSASSSLSLIQPQESLASVGLGICACFSQLLVGPLRGLPC